MLIAAQATIAQTKAHFLSKFNQGDIATASQVFTLDVRSFPSSLPQVDGQAALTEFWAGLNTRLGVTNVQLTTIVLEDHGDTVFEEGHFVLSSRQGVLDSGKYLVVWKQQPDGVWKWHRDFWNSNKS